MVRLLIYDMSEPLDSLEIKRPLVMAYTAGATRQQERDLTLFCRCECDTAHLACPHGTQGGCAKYKKYKALQEEADL